MFYFLEERSSGLQKVYKQLLILSSRYIFIYMHKNYKSQITVNIGLLMQKKLKMAESLNVTEQKQRCSVISDQSNVYAANSESAEPEKDLHVNVLNT